MVGLWQYSEHHDTPAKRAGEDVPAQRGKTVRLTANPSAAPFAVSSCPKIPFSPLWSATDGSACGQARWWISGPGVQEERG